MACLRNTTIIFIVSLIISFVFLLYYTPYCFSTSSVFFDSPKGQDLVNHFSESDEADLNDNWTIGFNTTEDTNLTISIVNNTNNTNVTETFNYTAVVPTENVTQKSNTSFNTSFNQTNTTDQNTTNITQLIISSKPVIIETIQRSAEIGKPVKWIRKIKSLNKTLAENLTPEDATNVLVNQKDDLYEVEYETLPPYKEEKLIEPFVLGRRYLKGVVVKSDSSEHYTNVKSYTNVPEELVQQGYVIRLYYILNGERVDITEDLHYNVSFVDSDGNGFTDRIEWIVPELSEVEFEIEADLTIINVQSYPTIGGDWTVRFNTIGTADLTITPVDNTAFGEDLEFLKLMCGSEEVSVTYNGTSVFFADWNCSEDGKIINKVLTTGRHTLEFRFGNDIEYAHNLVGDLRANSATFFVGQYSGTGAAGQSSNVNYTLTSNFSLAETGVTIKDAFIIFESMFGAYASPPAVTGYLLAFDSCQAPCTADALIGSGNIIDNNANTLAYSETESNYGRLLLNVTKETQLSAYTGNNVLMNVSFGYQFKTASTVANFIASTKAKLVITYTYDSSSASYTNTVVYPLESNLVGNQGTRNSSQATGCTKNNNCPLFNYSVRIPEFGNDLSQWFEVTMVDDGHGTNDVVTNVNIQGTDIDSANYVHEATNGGTQGEITQMLFSCVPGYNVNSKQVLEVSATAASGVFYLIGGEIFQTYNASSSALVRTKTVMFPIGTVTDGSITTEASASTAVYFPESNVKIEKAWFRIVVAGEDTDGSRNVIVASKVGSNARSNNLTYNLNVGGNIVAEHFTIYHVIPSSDYAELQSATGSMGKTVTLYSRHDTNDLRGASAVLMITYNYTDDVKGYLSSLSIFGGQESAAPSLTFTTGTNSIDPVLPETTGTKTIRGAALYASYLFSDTAGSMTSGIINVDANISTTATCSVSNSFDMDDDASNAYSEFYKNVTEYLTNSDAQTYTVCYSNDNAIDAQLRAKHNGILYYTYQWDDTTPPKWFDNSTNTTSPNVGDGVRHNVRWTDNSGLSYYFLEWNATGANCNAGFSNITEGIISGTNTWVNVSQTIPSACEGKVIGWRQYVNDTNNNWNFTGLFTYTVNPPPSLGNKVEDPASPAMYSPRATYRFNITVNDPNGEVAISTVIFEFNSVNETSSVYVVHNATARNYSVTKTDLAVGDYNYKWYANNSHNVWGNTGSLWTYSVIKNQTNPVDLYFRNSTGEYLNQNMTVKYEEQVNATGINAYPSSGTINLFREGINVTDTENSKWVTLGVKSGGYDFKVNTTGNENYTANTTGATYYLFVNKRQTTTYLWVNGTRQNYGATQNDYLNFTMELFGYPSRNVELWTNYSNGVWKLWDFGNSPLKNITQMTVLGSFRFIGNYSGNENYTYSEDSSIVIVSSISLISKIETMIPISINQSQNSTVVGNCSCNGGTCDNVYIEIQSGPQAISNTIGSDLQVNGSNPYYLGSLTDNWATRSWNITGWKPGIYPIKIKCNSTQTGNSFSSIQNLEVNDTENPTWSGNTTSPTSESKYIQNGQYRFNVTWDDNKEISTVLIEHNFTGGLAPHNDTVTTNDSNIYYFDINDLAVGSYIWKEYANDTTNNWNVTNNGNYWVYIVTKSDIELILENNESWSTTYPAATNTTGSGCPVQLTNCYLYRNDTGQVNNPDEILLGVGGYNYTYNTSGNQNYSANSISNILTVLKGNVQPALSVNTTWTEMYPTATNVSCSIISYNNEVSCNLYRNDTGQVNNPDEGLLGAGVYEYVTNTSETTNYTANSTGESKILTIQINTSSSINLFLNGSQSNFNIDSNQPVNTTAVLVVPSLGDIEIWTNYSDGTWKLWDSCSDCFSLENVTILTEDGVWNFTANFTNANYTSAYESFYVDFTRPINGWLNVNLTIPDPLIYNESNPLGINEYSTFTIEANVTCEYGQTCGEVNGTARYNRTDWWYTFWNYRIPIEITENSGNTLTDYQVNITLDTKSLILSGKMKSDCSDIRVVDSFGDSIPYYFDDETGSQWSCNGDSTIIWAQIQNLTASQTTTIYIYYGNNQASDARDEWDVFNYSTPQITAYVINDQMALNNLMIVSYATGNQITNGTDTLNLDEYGTGSLTGSEVTPISAKAPFMGDSDGANVGLPLTPIGFAGKTFINYFQRGTGDIDLVAMWGDANVTLYSGAGWAYQTYFAVPNGTHYEYTGMSTGSWMIASNVSILVTQSAEANTEDYFPLYEPQTDLWGVPSANLYGACLEDSTTGTIFYSNGTSIPIFCNIGGTFSLTGQGTAGNAPAAHIVTNKPVSAHSQADGDGTESTILLPERELDSVFFLPQSYEYIAIATTKPDTNCSRYRSGAYLDSLLSTSQSYPYPNKILFGSGNAGDKIICNASAFVYYERGTLYETNIFGVKSNRQYQYPEPTITSLAEQDGMLQINTSSESTPFYTISNQPQSCGVLNYGETCQLSWTINTTDTSAWEIDVNFNSNETSIAENDTENAVVNITYVPNPPPTLEDRIEIPSSPTTYSPGATYRFNITVDDLQGETDISTVIFEFNGTNETATTYAVQNSTARNYSITKSDLAANPSGYTFKWYANDSENQWSNIVEGTYIISKAISSIAISFSQNPVDYPIETTAACDKNLGGYSDILTLYRNDTQVAQGSGDSVSEIIILGAGSWNYTCIYDESENYTASLVLNRFLDINKGITTLDLLLDGIPNDLGVTYPNETNATGYENNFGDTDIAYGLYRNTTASSVLVGEGSNVQDVLILGANVYYCVYNNTEGTNWTANSLTRTLTVDQNISTINFINLTINGTESNKDYAYSTVSNATGWFNLNAFVGPTPVFTLYRNTTEVGTSNPVSDVIKLSAGFYNYTFYTSGNQNYSSATKQFNLTIEKADISPYLYLAMNGTEADANYIYENVTNATAWSTLTGQSEIIYNLYRNTSATSTFINSGTSVSDILRLGANTYYYVYNTSGNENYTSGSLVRTLTIDQKIPVNQLDASPAWTNTYPTQTAVVCSIPSINNEINAQLYRNSSATNPLPSTTETITLGGGAHNYTCNSTVTQNYTASSNSGIMVIQKNVSTASYMNLSLGIGTAGTENNFTTNYPTTTNATGWYSIPVFAGQTITFTLYRNLTIIDTSNPVSNVALVGNGTYNYTYYTIGNENYTSAIKNYWLFINKGDTSSYINLFIDNATSDKTIIYPAIAEIRGNISTMLGASDLIFNLFRGNSLLGSGNSTNQTVDFTKLGNATYTFVYNTTGGANWTSSSSVARILYVLKGNVPLRLAINGTETSQDLTYENVTNVTGWSEVTGEDLTFNLYRNDSFKGSGSPATETERCGIGFYVYVYNSSGGQNYTNNSTSLTLTINQKTINIYLALNGSQSNRSYTYPEAVNATAWKDSTINDEGVITLLRDGISKGSGQTVSEEILLGNGTYNYSAIFSATNYTAANILSNRFILMNKGTPIATLDLSPPSPIDYGTATTATCTVSNPESNAKLWRNNTDITSENDTPVMVPAGGWEFVCNATETGNYTYSEDSSIYTVNKAPSDVRLFLNDTEDNKIYTYEDYANITATLNISDKTFYIETNFTGTNQIINQGTNLLTNITNDFSTGLFNVTTYWGGNQNYTGDSQTYFITVDKRPTTVYLWVNGTREDKYYINKSIANLTIELVDHSGKPVELWTNYTDGQWKRWDSGNSPLTNITRLTTIGDFNFTANYSGNINYTESYESWLVTVGIVSLKSKLESLSPNNINQNQNSTVVGNCSCTGGTCYDAYIEIQSDGVAIPNIFGSNLQVNGSNPYYIGSLTNTWTTRSWNITGWESGNYSIRIMCNSTETGDSFSTAQDLQVNDTAKPTWNVNTTSPDSPTIYSPEKTYQFNITWDDNVDISTVLIEHNFTTGGSLTNDTMSNASFEYYFNVADLAAGIYVWKSYANDTSNNWNFSSQWIYVVEKAPTLTRLFLNGTEGDRTYNVTEVANFTVTLNISGKTVYLETDMSGWVIKSSITPLNNYTKLNQKGVFNITGYFLEGENYTSSSQTYYATVQDIGIPAWNNVGQNATWIGVNKTILLFANWTDDLDLDYAWLSTNETKSWENKTVVDINLTSDQTWSNFTWRNSSVPAGWVIGWRIYVNDSSGNKNATDIMSFVINASEVWMFPTGGFIYSSSAVGDVNNDNFIDVVFGSYDKQIYVLSGYNGTKIWNLTTNGSVASSPSISNLTGINYLDVAIGSYDFNMYVINGSSGNKIWNYSTGGIVFSSPAITDVNNDTFLDVIFGSADNKIYALNGSNGNLIWNYSTNGRVLSSPVISNITPDSYPIIFIGSYDFNMYAINGSNGTKLWSFPTQEKIESSPAVDDINNDGSLEVVFGSYDKKLYVINATNGQELWNYTSGNWITSSPVIADIVNSKKIIVGSHDSKIYAFNSDGTLNWTFAIPTGGRIPSSPSISDVNLDGINDVVVGATDGIIYAISGDGGSLLWSYNIGQYVFSSPSLADLNGDGSLDIAFGSLNKNQYSLDPPSWSLFGANQRRTRIFDNSPPMALNYGVEKNEGSMIIYSNWQERFSNLDYAIIEENSTGSWSSHRIKMKGMVDWANYSLYDSSFSYRIEAFDEYGNSKNVEGFVESENKDKQAPVWYNLNPLLCLNYSLNQNYRLNITWNDESGIEMVVIEHNFSGKIVNESVNSIDGNYQYSINDLPAGTYKYKEFAKDVYGNWNSTDEFILLIEKAQPVLNFVLPEQITYPELITSNCSIMTGDRNTMLVLSRNGTEIERGYSVSDSSILKSGFWGYSCSYLETWNYSYFEFWKNAEIRKANPSLSLQINPNNSRSCPLNVIISASEGNSGDDDVIYRLFNNTQPVGQGSDIKLKLTLKSGNYLFEYNSTEGENFTSERVVKSVKVADNSPPTNVLFGKKWVNGKRDLLIYSLWKDGCSYLTKGVIREDSTGIWKESEVELNGFTNWVNYTITEDVLKSEKGCKMIGRIICVKIISYEIKAFDEFGNSGKINNKFALIFVKIGKYWKWLI